MIWGGTTGPRGRDLLSGRGSSKSRMSSRVHDIRKRTFEGSP